MSLISILLLSALGSVAAWRVGRHVSSGLKHVAALLPIALFACFIFHIEPVASGGVVTDTAAWVPSLGIDLAFRLDGFSLLFALLITGIGSLVTIYATSYFSEADARERARFVFLIHLFMTAMLGTVLSDNLIVMFVFWEATSLTSFMLIGFETAKTEARRAALQSLLITCGGGLALLGAILLIGMELGSFSLAAITARAPELVASPLLPAVIVLLLIGTFTKSAQFPFHFWLPKAMAAPTPASAYLHSATMVKAGIFLLARLLPIFAGAALYHNLVTFVGLFTLCIAAFFAIFKEDLKGLLAYSTISHLGLIVCLLGIGSPLAVAAAIFHIINHATFKAALFMIAGIIDHESGTRDLRKLSGLWQLLPFTGTLTMITAASMAGVPLFNGFLSKEMFFTELLANLSGPVVVISAIVATLAGIFAVAYSVRLVHGVFFDGPIGKNVPNKDAHEPPMGMRAPALILAILCIAVGLFPALLVEHLVNSTTRASTQLMNFEGTHLAIWHGLNLPLLMSVIALVGGLVMYFALAKGGRIREIDLDPALGRLQGRVLFDLFLKGLLRNSRRFKRLTENGSLQSYLFWILVFTIALVSVPLLNQGIGTGTRELTQAPTIAIVLWLLLFSACWMMLWFHHERIKAVLISGAVGLVVTMIFVTLSAPDLAQTQITVDVVTTVLLLMSLSLLPQLTPYESSSTRRWRDAGIAILAGAGISWLAWLIMTRDHNSISWFFNQQSIPLGGGTNVVNVILVDFRGFDTFAEITVLGIAAIGALCLMDGMRAHGTTMTQGLTYRFNPSPLMLRMTASWILPVALVISLYIFLRGHNLPGGGFIAGLVTSMALIIQYIAIGQDQTEQMLKAKSGRLYEIWIGSGLTIAGLTGIAAWFWGRPFLTSAHIYVNPPVIGELHLASAALFDVGVYVTVVGATMLLISVLGDSRHSSMSGPIPRG